MLRISFSNSSQGILSYLNPTTPILTVNSVQGLWERGATINNMHNQDCVYFVLKT